MSEVARRLPTSYLKDPGFNAPIRIPLLVNSATPTGYECTTFDNENITVVAHDELTPGQYYEAIFDLSPGRNAAGPYDVALTVELGTSFDFHSYGELVKIMINNPDVF